MTQQQEQVPGDAGPTQSQQAAFQGTVNALAHHMMGLMVVTNIPPVMAALAASQIIRAALMSLVQVNPPVAKALLEELAQGLVEFMGELGIEPDINPEGKQKQ